MGTKPKILNALEKSFEEKTLARFGQVSLDNYRQKKIIFDDDSLPTRMISNSINLIRKYNGTPAMRAKYVEWESPYWGEHRILISKTGDSIILADQDDKAMGLFTVTHPQILPEYQGKGLSKYLYLAEAMAPKRILYPQSYSQQGYAAQTSAHKFIIETIVAAHPDDLEKVLCPENILRYYHSIPAIKEAVDSGALRIEQPYNIFSQNLDTGDWEYFAQIDDDHAISFDPEFAPQKRSIVPAIKITDAGHGESTIETGFVRLSDLITRQIIDDLFFRKPVEVCGLPLTRGCNGIAVEDPEYGLLEHGPDICRSLLNAYIKSKPLSEVTFTATVPTEHVLSYIEDNLLLGGKMPSFVPQTPIATF